MSGGPNSRLGCFFFTLHVRRKILLYLLDILLIHCLYATRVRDDHCVIHTLGSLHNETCQPSRSSLGRTKRCKYKCVTDDDLVRNHVEESHAPHLLYPFLYAKHLGHNAMGEHRMLKNWNDNSHQGLHDYTALKRKSSEQVHNQYTPRKREQSFHAQVKQHKQYGTLEQYNSTVQPLALHQNSKSVKMDHSQVFPYDTVTIMSPTTRTEQGFDLENDTTKDQDYHTDNKRGTVENEHVQGEGETKKHNNVTIKPPLQLDGAFIAFSKKRGKQLQNEMLITPSHRAAMTSLLEKSGRVFLAMKQQRSAGSRSSLPLSTLLQILDICSLGSDVNIQFYPVSYTRQQEWGRRNVNVIRRALLEALTMLNVELMVSHKATSTHVETRNEYLASKLRLVHTLAPSLCRLRRSVFDPFTGLCIPMDNKWSWKVLLGYPHLPSPTQK